MIKSHRHRGLCFMPAILKAKFLCLLEQYLIRADNVANSAPQLVSQFFRIQATDFQLEGIFISGCIQQCIGLSVFLETKYCEVYDCDQLQNFTFCWPRSMTHYCFLTLGWPWVLNELKTGIIYRCYQINRWGEDVNFSCRLNFENLIYQSCQLKNEAQLGARLPHTFFLKSPHFNSVSMIGL